jgi:hypothetical protein
MKGMSARAGGATLLIDIAHACEQRGDMPLENEPIAVDAVRALTSSSTAIGLPLPQHDRDRVDRLFSVVFGQGLAAAESCPAHKEACRLR